MTACDSLPEMNDRISEAYAHRNVSATQIDHLMGGTCCAPSAVAENFLARLSDGGAPQAANWLYSVLEDVRVALDRDAWLTYGRAFRDCEKAMGPLRLSPLTHRALSKPRGYAGDAALIDLLYGAPAVEEMTSLGSVQPLLGWERCRPAARAVRARRRLIADIVDDVALERPMPRIASIAAGHARELELSVAAVEGRLGKFVALDQDPASTDYVRKAYGYLGVEVVKSGVKQLIKREALDGQFDLIYSTGLYDYLPGRVAEALTDRLLDLVAPGGRLLIANFAPGLPDRGYMEAVMDWHLTYRDEADMVTLLTEPPGLSKMTFRDPTGWVVFLEVTR